jgi:hypothetical protein
MEATAMKHLLALLLFVSTANSATYWVHKSGSDGAAGTDSAHAFITIQHAVSVAAAGDTVLVCAGTYGEAITSQASGTAGAGNEIALVGYPGQTVIITGGTAATVAYQGRCLLISHDYWVVRNLTIKDNKAADDGYTNYYAAEFSGSHITVTRLRVLLDGNIPTVLTHAVVNAGYRGVYPHGQYFTMDSSIVRGAVQGITAFGESWQGGVRHHTFRADTVWQTTQNNVMLGGGGGVVGVEQAVYMAHCVLDTAGEDNIQFANNGVVEKSNSGILIQSCFLGNAQENGVDMKSCGATVTIENCKIVNSHGDDANANVEVVDDDGGAGIELGAQDICQYGIIRHNILHGNHSGSKMYPGFHIFNNTFSNNSHSYRGFNSTAGTYAGVVTDNTAEAGEWKRLINNIFYDEGGASNRWTLRIIKANASNFELDYNLYFVNGDSSRFVTNYPSDWTNPDTYTGLAAWKTAMAASAFSGWVGKDAHSWASDPKFVDVPAHPGAFDSGWDFTLDSGSPASGAAKALTTASGTGLGSTALIVVDPYYFRDSYGIAGIVGDSIIVGDENAVGISSVNYSTATLTLTSARTWSPGDSVWLSRSGVKLADLGAMFTPPSVAPPPPPPPTTYDTLALSWNTVTHNVTTTTNTLLELSDIQRQGVRVIVKNPGGFAVAWDDTITWLTDPPSSKPGAVSVYELSRGSDNHVYGEVKGGPVSGSSSYSSLTGNPYDNTALGDILSAFEARISALEDSLNIGTPPIVTGDSVTTAKTTGASLTFSHRCFGTNRLLVVSVSATWTGVTGVTYNGVALTAAETRQYSGFGSFVYYIVAPDTGTHDVVVSMAGSVDIIATASGFTGINQSTPIAGAVTAEGTSATPSITVSSATGDFVLDCVGYNIDGASSITATGGQTQIANTTQGSYCGHAVSTKAGAASVTNSWTINITREWAVVGLSINRL